MPTACTALGRHEVIVAVDLIHVGTLDPDGVVLGAGTLVDEDVALTDGLVGGGVELLDADGAVAVIFGLSIGGVVVVDDIGTAVVVEEEGGIDAAYGGQAHGFRPRSEGVLGGDEEVAPSYVGGDHIVGLVVGVILNGRGKDAAADMLEMEVAQLRRTVEHMAHLLPVHEVAAVEDGYTGVVAEGGGDEEVVALPVGADTGVGIPSGQDGIVEGVLIGQRVVGIDAVAAAIHEVVEQGRTGLGRGCLCARNHAQDECEKGYAVFFHSMMTDFMCSGNKYTNKRAK